MTGDSPNALSSAIRAIVSVLFGTLLVGLVATRITSYYTDARAADELKDDLATQVMALTTAETEGLRVMFRELSSEAVDEQQLAVDGRVAHTQGLLLLERIDRRLTSTAAKQYEALLLDLRSLRRLNGSWVCGEGVRRREAQHLYDRYRSEMKASVVEAKVVDALVGDTTDAEDCADHGEEFKGAATTMGRLLVLESADVAAGVDDATVEGMYDTRSEMLTSLVSDPVLIGLALSGVFLLALSPFLERLRRAVSRTSSPPTNAA